MAFMQCAEFVARRRCNRHKMRAMTPPPHRRALLAGLAVTGCASAAGGEIDLAAAIRDSEPDTVIPLWPNGAPGGENVTVAEQVIERPNDLGLRDRIAIGVRTPTLSVFRAASPNGSAMLIVPGGSYRHVVIDKEGFESARWFAARGVTCFVLRYRQPYDHWAAGREAPLQDAQRAMRVIRAEAARWGIDPAKVMTLGFSAGGHVAASLAIRYDSALAPSSDTTDALDAQPTLTALIYPVITMGAAASAQTRGFLLGDAPDAAAVERFSLERHVHARMAPTLLIAAADDDNVPVSNSQMYFDALGAAGVKREMHLFEEGGHGFALRFAMEKPVRVWPDLVQAWGQRHDVL